MNSSKFYSIQNSVLDSGLDSGADVPHLVIPNLSSGPGDIQQGLQGSQTGSDVLHLVFRVRGTQKLHTDP